MIFFNVSSRKRNEVVGRIGSFEGQLQILSLGNSYGINILNTVFSGTNITKPLSSMRVPTIDGFRLVFTT